MLNLFKPKPQLQNPKIMKRTFLTIATIATLLSCQKKEDNPKPETLVQNNTIVQRDSVYQLSSKVQVGVSLVEDSVGGFKTSNFKKFVDAPSFYETSKYSKGDTSSSELSNNFKYKDFKVFCNPKFTGITDYGNPNNLFTSNAVIYSNTNYKLVSKLSVSENIVADYYLVLVELLITNPADNKILYKVNFTTVAKAKI